MNVNGNFSLVETQPSDGSYATRANNFTYTAAGAVSSMQLGNGRWESTQFNSRLQPTQIALGTTQNGTDQLKLNYDYGTTANNGNVQSQTITVPGMTYPLIQTYSYDTLNRLKSAEEKSNGTTTWKQTFLFDRYGNRNFDVANTTTLGSCSQQQCNPTVSATNNRFASGQGYGYDSAGNVTLDSEGRQFTYDAENKQTQVKDVNNATVGTYFYDGDAKRVKKISTTETTVFAYDALGRSVEEYSGSTLQTTYVYAGSRLLTTETTTGTSYLTSDHLGSPRINTDGTGNVTARHDYMPYGEEVFSVGGRTSGLGYSSDSVRKKFTGYERDSESGLDFAQARYFDAGYGRFSSPDLPFQDQHHEDPQSWNLYIYVTNNPLLFVDPTGTMSDFVDDISGTITHIEDGKDQVLAISGSAIAEMQKLIKQNRGTYDAALAMMEISPIINLHLTRDEFMRRAATTYAESSFPWYSAENGELRQEMNSIAWVNTRNGEAFGARSADAKRFRNTAFEDQDDKMKLANLAIVNQRRGGPDPSNGAGYWDGMEQAQYGADVDAVRVPNPKNPTKTWILHKNTIGWSISDEDYAKWKKNVGSSFRAPQVSKTRSGKIGYYSTAVWARTIFWRK